MTGQRGYPGLQTIIIRATHTVQILPIARPLLIMDRTTLIRTNSIKVLRGRTVRIRTVVEVDSEVAIKATILTPIM